MVVAVDAMKEGHLTNFPSGALPRSGAMAVVAQHLRALL